MPGTHASSWRRSTGRCWEQPTPDLVRELGTTGARACVADALNRYRHAHLLRHWCPDIDALVRGLDRNNQRIPGAPLAVIAILSFLPPAADRKNSDDPAISQILR